MEPSLIARLVGLEYDLAAERCRLKELARELAGTGCDGCGGASADLHRAAALVRRALARIDGPLTEAARAAESLAPAPF